MHHGMHGGYRSGYHSGHHSAQYFGTTASGFHSGVATHGQRTYAPQAALVEIHEEAQTSWCSLKPTRLVGAYDSALQPYLSAEDFAGVLRSIGQALDESYSSGRNKRTAGSIGLFVGVGIFVAGVVLMNLGAPAVPPLIGIICCAAIICCLSGFMVSRATREFECAREDFVTYFQGLVVNQELREQFPAIEFQRRLEFPMCHHQWNCVLAFSILKREKDLEAAPQWGQAPQLSVPVDAPPAYKVEETKRNSAQPTIKGSPVGGPYHLPNGQMARVVVINEPERTVVAPAV